MVLPELPLDIAERVLCAEDNRDGDAHAVIYLQVPDRRLDLGECFLPLAVPIHVGLVEEHDALHRQVAQLPRVKIDHRDAHPAQLHNRQTLHNVVLL